MCVMFKFKFLNDKDTIIIPEQPKLFTLIE